MVLQAWPGSQVTAARADTPTATTGESLNREHPVRMDVPRVLCELIHVSFVVLTF